MFLLSIRVRVRVMINQLTEIKDKKIYLWEFGDCNKYIGGELVKSIYKSRTLLVVVTQVRVKGAINKCHPLRHEKVLDIYDNFNTYIVVVSLRVTTNFVHLCVCSYVMTSVDSIKVSMLSQNNNNTTLLLTLFVPYLRKS